MIKNKSDEIMGFRYGLPDNEVWKEQAVCKGKLHLFFQEKGESSTWKTVEAKRLCSICPVFDDCYEYGKKEKHGIWAGMSQRHRRKLSKLDGKQKSN